MNTDSAEVGFSNTTVVEKTSPIVDENEKADTPRRNRGPEFFAFPLGKTLDLEPILNLRPVKTHDQVSCPVKNTPSSPIR